MTCKAEMIKGQVKSARPLSRYATIDPANMDNNNVLLCSVTPLSDVEFRPRLPWTQLEENNE